MLNFRTFAECRDYFDRLPAAIETTRATARGGALSIGILMLCPYPICGQAVDHDEIHIAYHIEEDDSRGVAGLFFDGKTQLWTACVEL